MGVPSIITSEPLNSERGTDTYVLCILICGILLICGPLLFAVCSYRVLAHGSPEEAADALAPDLSLAMTPHFRYIYLTKMIIKYLYNGLPTAS
jgi:hypothetical protein